MADLSPHYNPQEVEAKWYKFWKEKNLFQAAVRSRKKPFFIIMPPPNVTGVLHMGHAMGCTLQDILIRFKRMDGFDALWVPGTDHAGISTQTVVEKHLIQTEGKRRADFTRDEFLKRVWQWKEDKEKNILKQIEKAGCSCDWSYLKFTLDEQCSLAVKTIFKKMFEDGLIYRGNYLVNWDPITQTAIADDEVEWEEKTGSLWYFRYPLAHDNSKYIVIATTRPETMLGDTAVAVAPDDPRYKDFIGQEIKLPLTKRTIPIIADSYVEKEFGTGALKITPAHDFNDHAIGTRHSLEIINIMNPDGTINENGGKEFTGLKMLKAREKAVAKMRALNLLEKIEPYQLRIGISYRSKAIIEPYLSKQWFVKMTAFKDELKKTVEQNEIQIIPEQWKHTYFHWINNLRDWCISRQLWWGHRIPIWYNLKNPDQMICSIEEEPEEVKKNPQGWKREEDVLDTWFSSALWPFSTLGWPEKTAELKKFFPVSVLITGHDILFFWVARMILMSKYALKKVPFRKTFLHGLIYGKSYWKKDEDGSITYIEKAEKTEYDLGKPLTRDIFSKWEKMSKSKGNIIDPLEIIEKYGTDAMRIALSSTVTHASQIDLDLRRFDEYKNFTNKIWNGARFVLSNLASLSQASLKQGLKKGLFTLEDKWILSRLNKVIQKERHFLENYEFDKAAALPYDFFWNDFCSYYLELCKPVLFGNALTAEIKENKQKLLLIILLNSLRLLHPITPFITEEIFQILKKDFGSVPISSHLDNYSQDALAALQNQALIITSYPKALKKDMSIKTEKIFAYLEDIVRAIRNIRMEMKIPPQEKPLIYFNVKSKKELKIIQENELLIKTLAKAESLTFVTQEKKLPHGASALLNKLKIVLPLSQEMVEKEKNRLIKEKTKIDEQIVKLEQKIKNPEFLTKAPKAIISKMKTQFETLQNHSLNLQKKIKDFQN